jgi:murein DD-endopeptidase MepM/ murein hydrolase activator NlpD
MPSRPFRGRRASLAVLLAVLAIGLFAPVEADDGVKEARRSREEARAAQARAAAQIDVLTAEDSVLAQGLTDIEDAVHGQQAAVDDASAALASVEHAASDRQAELAVVEADLAAAHHQVETFAIERYVGRRFDDAATSFFDSSSVAEAVRRGAILEMVHGSERDAVARLRALEADREDAVAAAETAVREADARRAELAAALAELEARRATQERLRDELARRIAAWESEQDELAAEEAELTELIKRRQLDALGVVPTDAGAASLQGFVRPASGTLGSGFGPRLHPIYRIVRMHSGVDIGGRTGDPVFAAKEGEILFAGHRGGYGNAVIIEHAGGVNTVYAHLSKIAVSAGDRVATGEAIGLIGSTGLSTGPHLHFEVRVGAVAKDPELFLP